MEVLERMVSESFARHGVEPAFDYRRVQWSRWFRCADSLSLALMSSKPGVFALGEEIVAPERTANACWPCSRSPKPMTWGWLLAACSCPAARSASVWRTGRCFARYAVIEDATTPAAHAALHMHGCNAGISESTELGTEN